MAKQKLTMESLTKLALVDNPANQHASVTIAKRHEPAVADGMRKRFGAVLKLFGKVPAPAAVLKEAETYGQAIAVNGLWEKNSALTTSISSIMSDDTLSDDDRKGKIDAALSAFRDDLLSIDLGAAVAKDAAACSVGDCGGKLNADGQCTENSDHVQKAADASDDDEDDPPPPDNGGDKPKPKPSAGDSSMKKVAKSFTATDIDKANAHIAELTEQIGKVEEERDTAIATADPLSEVVKGMTPGAAKIVRDQHNTIAKLMADRADGVRMTRAKSITKGMTDETGDQAALALVKCFDGVADDTERKAAEELVTKAFTQLQEVTKELDGYELGGAGETPSGADERDDKIEKAARELMKVDTKLTYPRAVSKALALDPNLYDDAETGAAE